MRHGSFFSVVAGMVFLAGSAFGAYQESFTGGFDLGLNPSEGGWQLSPFDVAGVPGGSYSTSTAGNYLRVSADPTPSGAYQVFGTVPSQPAEGVHVGGWVNVGQGSFPSHSAMSFIARANLANGNAYGGGFDGSGLFELWKMENWTFVPLGTAIDIAHNDQGQPWPHGPYTATDPFYIDFQVPGFEFNFIPYEPLCQGLNDEAFDGMEYPEIKMTVWDKNMNFLAYRWYTDATSTLLTGVSGFATFASAPGLGLDGTVDNINMSRLYGDANCDGLVTIEDYSALTTAYGGPGTWQDGDFTCDGMVTIEDYSICICNYGNHEGDLGGGVEGVPEPGSLVLILGGLAGRLGRRK
jgi:hypothetical protein